MMTVFNIPREQRTPETEIDLILSNLSVLYDEYLTKNINEPLLKLLSGLYDDALKLNGEKYEFVNIWFKRFYLDKNINGDELALLNNSICEKKSGEGIPGTLRINPMTAIFISLAYLCQAQRVWDLGRLNEAWTYVIDVREYSGWALQRAERIDDVKRLDHSIRISVIRKESRAKGVETYDYSGFILTEYKSRPWKDKTVATKTINEALKVYINKNNLPVKKFKSTNERDAIIETPQDDFCNLVWNTLPSAKQVKIDRDNFKNSE